MKVVLRENFDPTTRLVNAVNKASQVVLDRIEADLKAMIDREFYTLEQLEKMGHPYATKHFGGRISMASMASVALSNPSLYQRISKHTGGFNNVVYKKHNVITKSDLYGLTKLGEVGFDITKGPTYVKYVVLGTKKLVPRPLPYFYFFAKRKQLIELLRELIIRFWGF
ncbi:MAG: hypothetical protein QXM53_04670 [Thermofilaceae archaeon]